jgi:hypothetical protein
MARAWQLEGDLMSVCRVDHTLFDLSHLKHVVC